MKNFFLYHPVYSQTSGLGRNSELFEFYNAPKKSLITEGDEGGVLEMVQDLFSVLSWFPGPGSLFSAVNGFIYSLKGEYVKGFFSFIASLSGTVGKYVAAPFKKMWSFLPDTTKIAKWMWSNGGYAGKILAKGVIGLAKTNRSLLKKVVGKVFPAVKKIQKFLLSIIPTLKNFISKVSGGLLKLPKIVETAIQKVVDNLSQFFGKLVKVSNDFFMKKFGKDWIKRLLGRTDVEATAGTLDREGVSKSKSQWLNPNAPSESTYVNTGGKVKFVPPKIKGKDQNKELTIGSPKSSIKPRKRGQITPSKPQYMQDGSGRRIK